MNQPALLGAGGISFLIIYLTSLILIGWLGKRAQKENTLSDFYLAGRGMGLFVLFLTLYATQYSGNTLVGFSGRAYREGYGALVLIPFLSAAVGAFLIYAPKLFRLSHKHHFITPGDFIQYRFEDRRLTALASLLCIIALANYILTNLKAIGYIFSSVTGGIVPFAYGIILLALVMVIYETLGGMRSVAWTDVIQGIILLVGVIAIFFTIQTEYGGFTFIYEQLKDISPEKLISPNWSDKRTWFSTIALGFFGISIYPHAIQRIYSARNERALKRSIQIMAFMPLITVFFMVTVGIVGATIFPNLDRSGSEQITLLVLQDLGQRGAIGGGLMVLFLSATIAAIMSTVDSALLSISSIITKDFFQKIKPKVSQSELTRVGKILSWIIMGIAVYFAITLPQTIWRLLEIKLELLIQVAPAIFLGLHIKILNSKSVFWGMVFGTTFAVSAMVSNKLGMDIPAKPWGIHAGVWGFIINICTIFFMEKLSALKNE
ncbi:MAG: sodium:solute symporter family protein [Candidatus Marinimicrobia bacterium]|nr:sodium:solute symporter family protein [Candidatus Neomarinimicrobiota bacterium]MBL7031046.1 sodium:solute symporter family protein [Candidatus Neomarinimicrobiota bacterium]